LTDVKRAVQACRNAGLTIGRVEVDREGKIVIVPERDGEAVDLTGNEWD
jgi:hypothetical protein